MPKIKKSDIDIPSDKWEELHYNLKEFNTEITEILSIHGTKIDHELYLGMFLFKSKLDIMISRHKYSSIYYKSNQELKEDPSINPKKSIAVRKNCIKGLNSLLKLDMGIIEKWL